MSAERGIDPFYIRNTPDDCPFMILKNTLVKPWLFFGVDNADEMTTGVGCFLVESVSRFSDPDRIFDRSIGQLNTHFGWFKFGNLQSFRSFAFPDRGEDLGEFFITSNIVYFIAHAIPMTIRRIHQDDKSYSVPALTKDYNGIKAQYAVSRRPIHLLEIWNEYNILEDIKCGPYSKKSPIRHIQSLDMPLYLGRPIDHLGIGHTLRFDSTPLLRFVLEDISVSRVGTTTVDKVLETVPDAFD
ncbi:hypothetical protein Tco_1377605 [Tanacetum coccineum]